MLGELRLILAVSNPILTESAAVMNQSTVSPAYDETPAIAEPSSL